MTKAVINSSLSKSKGQVILEYLALALCLCVIALRTTYTEGLSGQSANQSINPGGNVYSLSMSAVLILSLAVWFVWSSCSKRFLYRFTAIEIGLGLFVIAAIVAGFAAANKRAAITDFVTLLAPVLMAVLLVQILDSESKIKLVLAVIVALGVLSAYQCGDQLLYWNEQQIKFYQQNPQAVLAQQNITVNSFAHWLFEHRLYSKDVHGFFTTSNSAGSFALLACFAGVALFLEKVKHHKSGPSGPVQLIICGIVLAVVIFGLVITRSKGAIAASLVAAGMFIAYLLFADWLKAHKKAILIACLLLVLAGGTLAVLYGLTYNRLPGGNSMLVRWQYWRGAAKMVIDHPITGVGGGNFSSFYPRYKTPCALETVKDPHNFLLTIITQYGPIGLAGFLAFVFGPLWKLLFAAPSHRKWQMANPDLSGQVPFIILAVSFLIIIVTALLVIRPMILRLPTTGSREEEKAAVILVYVMPVVVFTAGFLLLTAALHSKRKTQNAKHNMNITTAALCCVVVGVLIHNTIDFAIFEPGVSTTFWAIIACMIASDFDRKGQRPFVLKPAFFVRIPAVAAGLILLWAYFHYALIPVARSTAKIREANKAVSNSKFERAHSLLAAAADDDTLSPRPLSLNGRLYLQRFYSSGPKQIDLLRRSEKCLLEAIERNRADFKNFERLSGVYTLLAETSGGQEKTDYLKRAFDNALLAIECYPGCGRLRIELAKIAEQLSKTNLAIEQYKKAIEIEDSYRSQFQLMYPDRKIFSRLGEEEYKNAKQRIEQLLAGP